MKKMTRSFILGIAIFLMHLVIAFIIQVLIKQEASGYLSGLGAIVYYFIFAFWAYWLLSYIYIYITRKVLSRRTKYVKASLIIIIGYLFSRIPDIIDNDFLSDFKFLPFIMIFLLIPALVEFENSIRKNLLE